jgi:hypothetical protein
MCDPVTAIMVTTSLVGAVRQNQAASAAKDQAKAVGGIEQSGLQDQQQEMGVQRRGDVLSNALEAMRRTSTATVSGAEAGVSPIASVNNELMQESLTRGNIETNFESGIAQNQRSQVASRMKQDSAVNAAQASRSGILETGLSMASAGVAGRNMAAGKASPGATGDFKFDSPFLPGSTRPRS